MIVLARGRIVSEWYSGTFNAHVPHLLFSVSKSFTALVCAVLEAQGLLDPEKPVTHYVPEAVGSAYETARVRHVLDMTVGIDFEEVYLTPGSPFARYREAMGWNPQSDPAKPLDLHSFLMTLPPDGKPHGDAFHYVSPNSDLLGLVHRVLRHGRYLGGFRALSAVCPAHRRRDPDLELQLGLGLSP